MNSGSRGGTTASLAEAQQLYATWKADQAGWLKARILLLALGKGEYHGDQLEDVPIAERNLIGATVSGLVTQGLLVATGEHRKGKAPASHGRRSYVYVLTERGRSIATSQMRDGLIMLAQVPVGPAQLTLEAA